MLTCDDQYDLHLAPAEFSPDTSFKVGRDPTPSCHLNYDIDHCVHGFACQVQVVKPVPNTYYMACGFKQGYFGLQQHPGTMQQVLFSVWNHPEADARVEARSYSKGCTAQPFGGEGKGMQTFWIDGSGEETDHSTGRWKAGEIYTFVVRAFGEDGGTEFVCSLHKPSSGGWIELARLFQPQPKGEPRDGLDNLYSFIEDWTGNSGDIDAGSWSLSRSGVWAAWVQELPGAPWKHLAQVSGTCSVDEDVPNKRVAKVSHNDGGERIEMTAGGDVLKDFSLYKGRVKPPPVPEVLKHLK